MGIYRSSGSDGQYFIEQRVGILVFVRCFICGYCIDLGSEGYLLIKIMIGLIGMLLATACATKSVKSDYVPASESGKGVVSGSITYDGHYAGYRVWYRQIPEGESGFFEWGKGKILIPYFPSGDFEDQDVKGAIFAAELPAGTYELYRWSVECGAARITPTQPFSVRFTVEPGRAVYTGNFHFVETANLGLTVTAVDVTYSDAHERDLNKLKSKYPGFGRTPVAYAVAPGTSIEKIGGSTNTMITLPIVVPVN